jgi:hypothetical protein
MWELLYAYTFWQSEKHAFSVWIQKWKRKE